MQDSDLFAQLNRCMTDVARIQPLTDSIEDVLRLFYSFETPQVPSPGTVPLCTWQHVQADQ